MSSLEAVPDEIVRHILLYVLPEANLASVQLVSKRYNRLANESLLWKYYCRTSFRYWNPDHNFQQKLEKRASKTDWKGLWLERKGRNTQISHLLDGILATKVGRSQKFGQICRLGYDAKDFLLEQCRTDEAAEDVLARRYYGNTALASIHRSLAVQEWFRYQRTPMNVQGLDRALAAFDMFFIREDEGDIGDICSLLDDIAAEFLEEQDQFEDKTTREKALALLYWIRQKNLTGMDDPEENYRNLRNCLIGHALLDEDHPSLPIVSSAIYCCLAERIGLRAACCAFPSHVHAMVMAPAGYNLDGKPVVPPTTDIEKMFLDPYGSSEEVTLQELRSRLVELEWIHGREAFLVAAPVSVIVQRIGRNMKETAGVFMNTHSEQLRTLRDGRPASVSTLENATYAARWAHLLMTPVVNHQWDSTLDQFLSHFAGHFAEDAWMVEEYLLPLYDIFTQSVQPRHRFSWENVPEMLEVVRNLDQRQPTVNRRYTQDIHRNVWYKVGQVFRHKRYGYIGIINGWGEKGTSQLPQPHSLSMDEALDDIQDDTDSDSISARLRKKTFYTCLKSKVDRHVVNQDNVEIVKDPRLVPDSLMEVAGKFFKRFDRATCTFVSNIKEFFPDD